jgi:TetR/AcrR family transcriptional repressor of lmrAB and yxaGH operons
MSPASARERLLATTERLVAERGTHGVGLNEVCRESGVAYGSLYHAFRGGKDELVAESVERSGSRIGGALEALLAASDDFPAACRAVFEVGAAELAAVDFRRGCPVGTPVSDGHVTEPVRAAGGDAFARWTGAITAAAERAGSGPEQARELGSALVSLYEGALLVARARRSLTPLNDAAALAERLAREVLA